ncbi:hypothetical protein LCGC14_0372540 [marine sediment metagenome]|uniref:Uncharacterized protein n=1 Tax=marine sediment metagenome TaxID=412755 RepID=A0A0F9WDB9_9ZZZZ
MLTVTTKAKNWKAVTAGLIPIVEEAVFHVKKEGIECAVLDPSHTEGIGFNFTFMEPVLKSLKPYIEKNIFVEYFERAPIILSFVTDVCTIKYYLAPAVK